MRPSLRASLYSELQPMVQPVLDSRRLTAQRERVHPSSAGHHGVGSNQHAEPESKQKERIQSGNNVTAVRAHHADNPAQLPDGGGKSGAVGGNKPQRYFMLLGDSGDGQDQQLSISLRKDPNNNNDTPRMLASGGATKRRAVSVVENVAPNRTAPRTFSTSTTLSSSGSTFGSTTTSDTTTTSTAADISNGGPSHSCLSLATTRTTTTAPMSAIRYAAAATEGASSVHPSSKSKSTHTAAEKTKAEEHNANGTADLFFASPITNEALYDATGVDPSSVKLLLREKRGEIRRATGNAPYAKGLISRKRYEDPLSSSKSQTDDSILVCSKHSCSCCNSSSHTSTVSTATWSSSSCSCCHCSCSDCITHSSASTSYCFSDSQHVYTSTSSTSASDGLPVSESRHNAGSLESNHIKMKHNINTNNKNKNTNVIVPPSAVPSTANVSMEISAFEDFLSEAAFGGRKPAVPVEFDRNKNLVHTALQQSLIDFNDTVSDSRDLKPNGDGHFVRMRRGVPVPDIILLSTIGLGGANNAELISDSRRLNVSDAETLMPSYKELALAARGMTAARDEDGTMKKANSIVKSESDIDSDLRTALLAEAVVARLKAEGLVHPPLVRSSNSIEVRDEETKTSNALWSNPLGRDAVEMAESRERQIITSDELDAWLSLAQNAHIKNNRQLIEYIQTIETELQLTKKRSAEAEAAAKTVREKNATEIEARITSLREALEKANTLAEEREAQLMGSKESVGELTRHSTALKRSLTITELECEEAKGRFATVIERERLLSLLRERFFLEFVGEAVAREEILYEAAEAAALLKVRWSWLCREQIARSGWEKGPQLTSPEGRCSSLHLSKMRQQEGPVDSPSDFYFYSYSREKKKESNTSRSEPKSTEKREQENIGKKADCHQPAPSLLSPIISNITMLEEEGRQQQQQQGVSSSSTMVVASNEHVEPPPALQIDKNPTTTMLIQTPKMTRSSLLSLVDDETSASAIPLPVQAEDNRVDGAEGPAFSEYDPALSFSLPKRRHAASNVAAPTVQTRSSTVTTGSTAVPEVATTQAFTSIPRERGLRGGEYPHDEIEDQRLPQRVNNTNNNNDDDVIRVNDSSASSRVSSYFSDESSSSSNLIASNGLVHGSSHTHNRYGLNATNSYKKTATKRGTSVRKEDEETEGERKATVAAVAVSDIPLTPPLSQQLSHHRQEGAAAAPHEIRERPQGVEIFVGLGAVAATDIDMVDTPCHSQGEGGTTVNTTTSTGNNTTLKTERGDETRASITEDFNVGGTFSGDENADNIDRYFRAYDPDTSSHNDYNNRHHLPFLRRSESSSSPRIVPLSFAAAKVMREAYHRMATDFAIPFTVPPPTSSVLNEMTENGGRKRADDMLRRSPLTTRGQDERGGHSKASGAKFERFLELLDDALLEAETLEANLRSQSAHRIYERKAVENAAKEAFGAITKLISESETRQTAKDLLDANATVLLVEEARQRTQITEDAFSIFIEEILRRERSAHDALLRHEEASRSAEIAERNAHRVGRLEAELAACRTDLANAINSRTRLTQLLMKTESGLVDKVSLERKALSPISNTVREGSEENIPIHERFARAHREAMRVVAQQHYPHEL